MNTVAFSSFIFLSAYTPGPNNIMAMTNSARMGFKKTLPFVFGVLIGFGIDMTLCAIFTTMLLKYIPAVTPYLKWIGAAYIIYLAYVIVRDKPHSSDGKQHLAPGSMLNGMVMQFVNVKVILYGITALSTFVLPVTQKFSHIALAVLALVLVGASGTCTWAIFGSLIQNIFEKYRKQLNIVMGLLLVYCAISSVLK